MINNNDIKTLEILCSLDETLNKNSAIDIQPDLHQNLIHHATLKITDWLNCKFKMPLEFHLDRVNFLDEKHVHFTLSCQTFAQALFFNISFNVNGELKFSSNVDFTADIYVQQDVATEQNNLSVA